MARLTAAARRPPPPGVRVVIDIRPLQEPEWSPITAEYLDELLTAFAAEPLAGESFVVLTRAMRDDPSQELEDDGLPVVGRRVLPPTNRVFRSAGLTLDSFLLRGAELGTSRGADVAGAAGAVYHTAGGAVPLASGLPVVATLLDLAAWELPAIYATSAAARFGHRLRARVLRDAARVIVCSRATAESARRRLHLPAERVAVIPLAVDDSFRELGRDSDAQAELRQRLGLPDRYLLFSGRYDARRDMASLFGALRLMRDEASHGAPRPAASRRVDPTRRRRTEPPAEPPLLVIAARDIGAAELTALERAVERAGVSDVVRLAPQLGRAERAALIGGSRALVYPCLSEGTGLPALEALSLGVPVICSRAGALPEIVGNAGIVVEPRDPPRLAAAMSVLWAEGALADQLRRQAARRADGPQRSWQDVARETREAYAVAAGAAPVPDAPAAGSARRR